MSNLFKLLIMFVVLGALLYLILTIFVFPKEDVYPEIIKTIQLAQSNPGEPYCSIISLDKDQQISTKIISASNYLNNNLFLWFANLDPNGNIYVSKEFSVFSLSKKQSNYNFCSICFPKFIFNSSDLINNKDVYCELIFGKKLSSLNFNFASFENLEQGSNIFSFNGLPENYSYNIYLINQEKEETITKDSLIFFNYSNNLGLEKKYSFSSKDVSKENDFLIENAGTKIIVQALIQSDFEFLDLILPAKFNVLKKEILPNDNYLQKNCVTKNSEKQYLDYDLDKCVVYNYCEGCFLASDCFDIWKKQGVDVISQSNEYAISYLPSGECN